MHRLEIGKNQHIEFELIRKNVKNINLTVRPDFSITVSAKNSVPIGTIYDYIDSKSHWILKRIGLFRSTKAESNLTPEFVSGETFKFLGKQYRLRVELTASTERVSLVDGYIVLYVRNKLKTTTKSRLIDEWYRKEAKTAFLAALDRMFEIMEDKLAMKPSLEFKIMKKRWGSCLRAKNTISLNLELIKAPAYCIDYVVLHELLHFIHRNHNSDFYELLTVLMPDWKHRKDILDQEVVLYI